jgi:hypothetical protein
MLRLKRVNTVPVRVEIAIGEGRDAIRGHVTAHAIIRSKDEMKAIAERDWNDDAEFIRYCYERVDGLEGDNGEPLEGDAAFAEILTGPFSMYLTSALSRAYVEQYSDAHVGNSKRSRSR